MAQQTTNVLAGTPILATWGADVFHDITELYGGLTALAPIKTINSILPTGAGDWIIDVGSNLEITNDPHGITLDTKPGFLVENINGVPADPLNGEVTLIEGANITITPNPLTHEIEIAASGGGGGVGSLQAVLNVGNTATAGALHELIELTSFTNQDVMFIDMGGVDSIKGINMRNSIENIDSWAVHIQCVANHANMANRPNGIRLYCEDNHQSLTGLRVVGFDQGLSINSNTAFSGRDCVSIIDDASAPARKALYISKGGHGHALYIYHAQDTSPAVYIEQFLANQAALSIKSPYGIRIEVPGSNNYGMVITSYGGGEGIWVWKEMASGAPSMPGGYGIRITQKVDAAALFIETPDTIGNGRPSCNGITMSHYASGYAGLFNIFGSPTFKDTKGFRFIGNVGNVGTGECYFNSSVVHIETAHKTKEALTVLSQKYALFAAGESEFNNIGYPANSVIPIKIRTDLNNPTGIDCTGIGLFRLQDFLLVNAPTVLLKNNLDAGGVGTVSGLLSFENGVSYPTTPNFCSLTVCAGHLYFYDGAIWHLIV